MLIPEYFLTVFGAGCGTMACTARTGSFSRRQAP